MELTRKLEQRARQTGKSSAPEPAVTRKTVPALPAMEVIHPAALEPAFAVADGFHRADWEFISRWIEANAAPPDHEAAWTEAALLWLTKLRDDLGGDYFILPASQTLVLCDLPVYEPGDPNELSYSLAEVFVKLLSERGEGPAFRSFIEHAHQDDAGQGAAMDCLSADLGGIAGTFLGRGDWRPRRSAMVACWKQAGWA